MAVARWARERARPRLNFVVQRSAMNAGISEVSRLWSAVGNARQTRHIAVILVVQALLFSSRVVVERLAVRSFSVCWLVAEAFHAHLPHRNRALADAVGQLMMVP